VSILASEYIQCIVYVCVNITTQTQYINNNNNNNNTHELIHTNDLMNPVG